MSTIGMMDDAYFVGKNAILQWINTFLGLQLTKIEQTASGAVHCQLLDCLFPGRVPLHKVNFDAKFEHEFINNYKVLQEVFDKENITKHVDVQKLTKGKYQDNLEFCQWMKGFFDSRYNGAEYNAVERRDQARAAYKKGHKHAGTTRAPGMGTRTTAAPIRHATAAVAAAPTKRAAPITTSRTRVPASPVQKINNKDQLHENMLNEEIAQLNINLETMQKERDFYFGKLREIEILCQEEGGEEAIREMKQHILAILYASESDEFQSPAEVENADEEPQIDPANDGLLND